MRILPMITVLLLLSGCNWLGTIMDIGGGGTFDPTHGPQQSAVQAGDEAKCDKVIPPSDYAKAGSNPPRDKCIMMVAANTEAPNKCSGMKGGIGSYTPEECVTSTLDGMQKKAQRAIDSGNVEKAQKELDAIQKNFEMLSNIEKSKHDMQMAAVRNLRG